ncbi:hypothetical protein [Streptomyces niveus]|uniref:hypothetical protein n=1 Tax=Streptomyces niveus TaxID=193462 RepID=UPI0035DB6F25
MSDAPNDDALYAALTDADLLKALAPYLPKAGGAVADAGRLRDITRRQLVRCEVVRLTERREQAQRTAFGVEDLSALPLYEGAIADHSLPEPKGPGKLVLVRAGSVQLVLCPCDNGERQCDACTGRGWHACGCHNEPLPCDVCHNVTPCRECERQGRKPIRPSKARPAVKGPTTTAPGAPRVTCARCDTPEAACPRCEGRGLTRCRHCDASGRETCEPCSGRGLGTHDVCGGKGSLTHWVEGRVVYANEPRSLSLPAPDWPDKVKERLRAADWQRHDVPTGGPVPTALVRAYRSDVRDHLAPQLGERSRQVTLRTTVLARVELADDPNRVYYVFPGAGRLEVVTALSDRLKQRLVAAGAVIVIVVVLILWLAS